MFSMISFMVISPCCEMGALRGGGSGTAFTETRLKTCLASFFAFAIVSLPRRRGCGAMKCTAGGRLSPNPSYFPAPQAVPHAEGFGSGFGLPAPQAVPVASIACLTSFPPCAKLAAAVAAATFLLLQEARFFNAIMRLLKF